MEFAMGHVVLLGDSIFDNARYVPDRSPVIDQVRQSLPRGWTATLLAVDGHVTDDIVDQLRGLPSDATHLVASAGGNDALSESSILREAACTVGEALSLISEVRSRFGNSYRSMLRALSESGKPLTVCTVYDSIPGLGPAEQTALACFNELILREAFSAGLPVLDLRLVCDRPADYSHVSAIEPSAVGGAKIARAIAAVVTSHDFARRQSTVYF
jgi:hypothetical protein